MSCTVSRKAKSLGSTTYQAVAYFILQLRQSAGSGVVRIRDESILGRAYWS
ncbi:hypothetical protein H634G_05731 [Metarhizium anisopliae BRIP 53293]|uniref:Uncharacterized protein n=1 Tax=Metarhizium anisopliae BRIP 53293 TaxID=1291518 RepID=A0A0D9NYH9_METAN|nr:hypothetical protein H634G_05731 [Metarhizium anisopliae BRIP 53293]KJK92185.1 hypothetical protein H633G_03946 [Metarhizium anisopliae BRIP 53284]